MQSENKRGYLSENYRLFHISDRRDVDFESHSHDFHKIIVCLSGSVTYIMEGKTYFLRSRDILLVPKGTIHKSSLSSAEKYERVVFWIDDGYLRSFEEDGNSLATCFDMAHLSGLCALGTDRESFSSVLRTITSMESLSDASIFGKRIMRDAYFTELMVILNRIVFEQKPNPEQYVSDPKFDGVLEYISNNLASDLSVESLSKRFFISRSYLMHRFKELTGCSVHEYITQKRLTDSLERIKRGENASEAASSSGFADYTVFYRNFKRVFGVSPAQIIRR